MLVSHLILFETHNVAKFHWLPPGMPMAWLWHAMLLLPCLQMKASVSHEGVISGAEQCSQLQNCVPPVISMGIVAAYPPQATQSLRCRYWQLPLLPSAIQEQAGLLLSADLPSFDSLDLSVPQTRSRSQLTI